MAGEKDAGSVPITRFGRLKKRFPILRKKRGVALVTALTILPLFGLLGLLALRNRHGGSSTSNGAGGTGGDSITDDTYFYGQSEPVYPSRKCFH
jgi:beta-glucosidase